MLRPTLIVALGGTGTNVSLRLRDLYEMRYGTPNPAGVHFLFVDTDIRHNPALSDNNFPGRAYALSVSAGKVQDLQNRTSDERRRLNLDTWFDRSLLERLTNQNFEAGVGGVRMYGRLSLLASRNLSQLLSQLVSDIQGMGAVRPGAVPQAMQVLVIASAGGGTGSGTFLDMGYLTKIAVKRAGIADNLCKCEGIVAVAVPTLVASPNYARNSAAMLSELDYYSEARNVFEANYAGTALPPAMGREAPYDYVYLVSPTIDTQIMDTNPANAIRKLEHKIADYLFVRTTEADVAAQEGGTAQNQPAMGEAGARLTDMAQNWVQVPTDRQGYSLRFLTFGVSLRMFPIGLCAQLGFRRAVDNFVNTWLKPAEPGMVTLNAQWLSKQRELETRYRADLNELRALLGLRKENERGPMRDCKDDELYKSLIQTREAGLESALVESAHNGTLNDMFAYDGGSDRPRPGSGGYIAGTINFNARGLLTIHDAESLPNKLRAWFWEAAFDVVRGPRYVLSVLRAITDEMEADIARIKETLKEFGKSGDGNAAGGAGVNREQAVRGDGLLLLWKETAAQRERGHGNPDAAARANRKYEECLLEARLSVYAGLQAQVFDNAAPQGHHLSKRLENLIVYITAWNKTIQQDKERQEQLLASLPTEIVYSDEILNEKMRALAPVILPATLEALLRLMNAEGFDKALPTRSDHSTDFEPFATLETGILNAMQSRDGGNDTLYGDSVIRLMGIEGGEAAIRAQADAMLLEGRPLLNLNLAAAGYGEILGADPPVFQHTTYFWGLAAQNTLDPASYRLFTTAAIRQGNAIGNQLGIANAAPQLLRSDDGSVAACIFLRNAFPTRIINGYEPDERSRRVNPEQVTEDTISTPHIDIRIRTPIPQERIAEAERLLLLAEMFLEQPGEREEYPRLTISGTAHTLNYTRLDRRVGTLDMPKNGFKSMAYQLALDSEAVKALRLEFNRRKAITSQHGYYAETFITHIRELNALLKQRLTEGRYQPLDLRDVDYDEMFDLVEEGAASLGVPLDPTSDPSLIDWAEKNQQGYWVCKGCGNVLGKDTPSLRPSCPEQGCINERPAAKKGAE